MKVKFVVTALAVVIFGTLTASAQVTEERIAEIEEQCESAADRLEELLDLEPWQTFRVDSTMKSVYIGMNKELTDMQSAKFGNATLYQQVQDKWMDQLDASYKKIFTAEQWDIYLKQGAARMQKARDKRREKLADGAAQKKK